MKVSIYGIGYVGLITGVCLAHLGYEVCCMDTDEEKVQQCRQGVPPIYESGLVELLQTALSSGRIFLPIVLKEQWTTRRYK